MKAITLTLLLTSFLLVACIPGPGTRATQPRTSELPTLQGRYATLSDALRAQPRLVMNGDRVFLRTSGASSLQNSNEVVFALGRQVLGTYVQSNGAIDLADVARFRVLNGLEGGEHYGMLGSNGVVEIVPVRR